MRGVIAAKADTIAPAARHFTAQQKGPAHLPGLFAVPERLKRPGLNRFPWA
jgi:hypothetical protein